MKMFEFRLKFHWSLFPRVQLTIFQHWFREWLGAVQATSHYLNQWWLVYRRIYASFGLNELKSGQFTPNQVNFSYHMFGRNYHSKSNFCASVKEKWVNSLAHGRFAWNVILVIFKLTSVIDGWGISCEIALSWWSLDSLMISQHWVR